MTINIPKTIEQETTVPIPSFWRNGSDFVAIVDDDTAIALYAGSRLTCIRHADPEILRADIITAHSKWDLCEEVHFMDEFLKIPLFGYWIWLKGYRTFTTPTRSGFYFPFPLPIILGL